MIVSSEKEIPIGTILKKDVMEFTGYIDDMDGKLVGNGKVVVMILREATKEEFLNQFKEEGININQSTIKFANDPKTKFYEISTD